MKEVIVKLQLQYLW